MDHDRSAGDISSWLTATAAAPRGDADADVDCDGCIGCCASSQFVHIRPDETRALASIPTDLLFPAPGLPTGHVLMGYDERGRCPMLTDDGCSIYESRPATCRVFDCRVFAATGVEPDPSKPLVAEAASRWKSTADDEYTTAQLAALRAAAVFVERQRDDPLFAAARHSATGHAVLAVEVYPEFLGGDRSDADVLISLHRKRRMSIDGLDPG